MDGGTARCANMDVELQGLKKDTSGYRDPMLPWLPRMVLKARMKIGVDIFEAVLN